MCFTKLFFFVQSTFLEVATRPSKQTLSNKVREADRRPKFAFYIFTKFTSPTFRTWLGSVVAHFKRAKSYNLKIFWTNSCITGNILNKYFYHWKYSEQIIVSGGVFLIFAVGHFYLKLPRVSNLDKTDAKCVSSIIHKKRAREDKKWQIEFEKHKFSPTE